MPFQDVDRGLNNAAMSTVRKKAKKASTAVVGTPVERLFAVLNLAAKMGMISAADIVYLLDLPRPTAHRMTIA